jgi:hypothetical protein
MASPSVAQRDEILTLSREQIIAILEREAKKRLGLSARELFRRYARGELKDPGRVSDLVILSHLLPENDELFAAA